MIDFRKIIPAGKSSPGNIMGIVIAISVVLLVLWLFMVSRMDYQPSTASEVDPVSQERRDSVRVMMGKADVPNEMEQRSSRMFLNAFTTFMVLMAILVIVWVWSRKKTAPTSGGGRFPEIGRHVVGPGQQIKILEINNEIWVIGVGTDAITLLHRYPKDQWNEPLPETPDGKQRFYDIFSGKS